MVKRMVKRAEIMVFRGQGMAKYHDFEKLMLKI